MEKYNSGSDGGRKVRRASNPLSKLQVGCYKVLGREEEVALFRERDALRAVDADMKIVQYNYDLNRAWRDAAYQKRQDIANKYEALREKYVRSNLPLASKFASKIARIYPGLDVQELISRGNQVLMRTFEDFDLAKECKSSTYAVRGMFLKFRSPLNLLKRGNKLFSGSYDYHIEVFESCEKDPLGLLMEGESSVLEMKALGDALSMLPDYQRNVICRRFGINGFKETTLVEIAKIEKVTREAIRQREIHALEKLRELLANRF